MKIKYIIPLLLVLFTFACENEPTIFEQINEETKLEDAVITGSVHSIVKLNSKLYASDGNIYVKDETAVRGWSESSKPDGDIIKLAAGCSKLYALNQEKKLFSSTDGSVWEEASCKPSSGKSIKTIFCNGKDTAYLQDSDGKIEKICDGTKVSSGDVPSTVILVTSDTSKTYYAEGGTVKGKNGDDLGSVSDLGTVYSLTYSKTDKAVYAGTSKGLRKLPVGEDGKLTGENLDPPGNWGSTIKNYEAFAVLATENHAALYTSTIETGSAYAKINGLWGYYYSRRDTWNRE